jgi:hypothetical protein
MSEAIFLAYSRHFDPITIGWSVAKWRNLLKKLKRFLHYGRNDDHPLEMTDSATESNTKTYDTCSTPKI